MGGCSRQSELWAFAVFFFVVLFFLPNPLYINAKRDVV